METSSRHDQFDRRQSHSVACHDKVRDADTSAHARLQRCVWKNTAHTGAVPLAQREALENDLKAVKIGGKFNVSDIVTKYLNGEEIDKILHIMGMHVHDSQCCIASIHYNSSDTGEGVDYWIRTQKEQWPGSDGDKPQVTEFWREIMKEHHDKLKNEVIAKSRWLREHVRLRRHCHPLYHPQGPRQARHVPRMRISAFVDGSNKWLTQLLANTRSARSWAI